LGSDDSERGAKPKILSIDLVLLRLMAAAAAAAAATGRLGPVRSRSLRIALAGCLSQRPHNREINLLAGAGRFLYHYASIFDAVYRDNE